MKNRKLTMVLIFATLTVGVVLVSSGVFSSDNPIPNVTLPGVLDGEDASPGLAQVENLQEELETNINRWMGGTLGSSGWLHVVTRHDREKDQASSLPSGQIIPDDYIMESWYFLNGEGLVSELVTLMTDLEGNVIQVSTFSNGIWKNLTMDEEWTGLPFELKLDFGLSKDIARSSQTNVSTAHYTSELDGTPVDVYSVEDHFDEPVHMNGYNAMIMGGARKGYFDSNSGALLTFERTLTAEDGTIYVVEQASYLTLEHVDTPPDPILEYLDEE
jgi:hypothetical protein